MHNAKLLTINVLTLISLKTEETYTLSRMTLCTSFKAHFHSTVLIKNHNKIHKKQDGMSAKYYTQIIKLILTKI